MAKIELTQAQKEVLEALMKCKNFEPNPKLGIRKSRRVKK